MQDFSRGSGLIFMKVGTHAREPLEQIIERKRRELNRAGKIFWGYGGTTCHPTRTVRPFAAAHAEVGRTVTLVMQKMTSRQFAEPDLAKEYSQDGVNWRPIPRGIEVRGSRYAMVLGSLEDENVLLDLDALRVWDGRCRGNLASQYLRGHVDKACLEVLENPFLTQDGRALDRRHVAIGLTALVVEPYAVFLR